MDGTIASTDAGQEENPDALVDGSDLTLTDMGSMGGGNFPGGGPGDMKDGRGGSQRGSSDDTKSKERTAR